MKRVAYIFLLSTFLSSCFLFDKKCKDCPIDPEPQNTLPSFLDPAVFPTPNSRFQEASGIAASTSIDNSIWVIEDSSGDPGIPSGIHLVNSNGVYRRYYPFNFTNKDWEDLAVGPGPEAGQSYIYIGDIGDNKKERDDNRIYRLLEPKLEESSVERVDQIRYRYSTGQKYNSETLLLDPQTRDLYIITKEEFNVLVFRISYPQSVTEINNAEFMGTIPYTAVVGGSISAKGDEVLLKTYFSVLYWKRKEKESIYELLKRNSDLNPKYVQEPQGESIAWDKNASGYYTLSESLENPQAQKLYYYPKK
ncbi:MAG: PE-PGRS family protein [Leadbetterella sp.]